MDFYALNVAPLNGWETHIGSGRASANVSTQASAYLVMSNGEGHAQVAATGNADGMKARLGQAVAGLTLNVQGTGYSIIHGVGSVQAEVITLADGGVIPFMGGHAQVVLSAQANAMVAKLGVSYAPMLMYGAANGRRAVLGAGRADAFVFTRYGIPEPFIKPVQFEATHASRRLKDSAIEGMKVAQDRYDMNVMPKQVMRVPRET